MMNPRLYVYWQFNGKWNAEGGVPYNPSQKNYYKKIKKLLTNGKRDVIILSVLAMIVQIDTRRMLHYTFVILIDKFIYE